ncbi:MAG: leucyl aminopeptidase [Crocinitomicaceae bacterium]|jgi:leucyl aminopeptidase|nr:leucyl aminopeptidase [Crocinitomicaceae bacterium]
MLLQSLKKTDYTQNLLFILSEKGKPDSKAPAHIQRFAKVFQASKKEFDFLKTEEQQVFFIKENKDREKNRVAGHTLRTQLDKDAKELTIIGENEETAFTVAEGLLLSNYQFLKYFKDAAEKKYGLQSVYIDSDKKKIKQYNQLIEAVYWTRDMVNEPVSYLTATQLSQEIEKLFEGLDVEIDVFEKSKIEALKMGGLLAVNKGSVEPPTFTIIEYKPKKAVNKKPLVLVGKGVVYDTGGLSLKPTPGSMDLMKSDMAGAAMMAGTVYAAAKNELNVHLVALIPATDNRPGMDAYTPGDIITMFDGTTVEVLNTDAEGRMILADALSYSQKYDPELVINSATLTGAAVVAIGTRATCMMGNADQKVLDKLTASGLRVHERVVQLPFWDEYLEDMKSSVADLKNIGGRYAGMITAGKFLEHFVKAPFVHLDIAGPSFLEATENYKGKGGTGVGVRLLYDFLEHKSKSNA